MSLRQHDTRLSRLAAQHEQFLTQAQACIAKDVAAAECDPYKAFLSGLARHLDAHKQWLGTPDRSARTVVQWGPVTATRESGQDGKPALHIHGPTPGDEHICAVANDETAQKMEADIQLYDKMTQALARAASQESGIFGLQAAAQTRRAADTDQKHIGLLKEYNDVRDVGQQLIGIIAENRGLPVRSLYADGSFGVGPDD